MTDNLRASKAPYIVSLFLAAALGSHAGELRVGTICVGAARLDNGSIVTIGQPLGGFMSSAGGEMSLSAGVVPMLEVLSGGLPAAPVISPGSLHLSGTFGFHFTTQPGRNYLVEASTNLTTWAPVGTNLGNGNDHLFLDPNSALFPKRFYRVATW
jgi:hypothetical protein